MKLTSGCFANKTRGSSARLIWLEFGSKVLGRTWLGVLVAMTTWLAECGKSLRGRGRRLLTRELSGYHLDCIRPSK